MKNHRDQNGITLVVSLIMLVILTLIVVSAIRFGNINLKIAGNAQAEVEASAATQVAIEKMIVDVAASKIDSIAAQPQVTISTGGATYKVDVQKPVCLLSKSVKPTSLDPSKDADRPCFQTGGATLFDNNGKPIPVPTACNDQQWEIGASLSDATSGARVSMLQGVALRSPAQVDCP